MRGLLLAAVLMTTALAGCADGEYLGMEPGPGPQEPAEDGNTTTSPGNQTDEPDSEPAPRPKGTFVIGAPDNVTLGDEVEIELNFYHPGREPVPPTRNSTGNVTDPGRPGTPAHHDDVFWSLVVASDNETLSFNGTSVPAIVPLSFNQTGNVTLTGQYTQNNRTVEAEPVGLAVVGGAVGGSAEPVVFSGSVMVPLMANPAVGCDPALPEYVDFGPEYWGWTYQAKELWIVEFWQGGTYLTGGASGVVPEGSDSVGGCPAMGTVTNGMSWAVTLTPPEG